MAIKGLTLLLLLAFAFHNGPVSGECFSSFSSPTTEESVSADVLADVDFNIDLYIYIYPADGRVGDGGVVSDFNFFLLFC